jgi:hypothetical protein
MAPITELQGLIYTNSGFPHTLSNDEPVWTGATPTAGIIAAVAALPAAGGGVVPYAALLNLEHSTEGGLTRDPLITALVEALTAVDAAKATAFLAWHYAQWKAALKTIHDASMAGCEICWSAVGGFNLGSTGEILTAACTAAGLTRTPITRGAL